jgi:hypothetical protein
MKRFVWLLVLICAAGAFAQPAVQWTTEIAQPASANLLWVWNILQDQNGDILAVGCGGDDTHPYVTRLNVDTGDTLWTRTYPRWYSGITDACEIADGDFLLCGGVDIPSNRNFSVARITSTGDTMWTRRGPGGTNIFTLSDSEFVLGWSSGLVRINGAGDTIWTRQYAPPESWHYATSPYYDYSCGLGGVSRAANGEFLLFGTLTRTVLPEASYLYKVDSTGTLVDSLVFSGYHYSAFCRGRATADGGIVLITRRSRDTVSINYNNYILKLDAQGDTVWCRWMSAETIGELYDVAEVDDGAIIVARSVRDAYNNRFSLTLTKLSMSGEQLWDSAYYAADTALYMNTLRVIRTADRGLMCVGFVVVGNETHPREFTIAVKLAAEQQSSTEVHEFPAGYEHCRAFPNPFNPSTSISFDLPRSERVQLRVFDVTGRCVSTLADGEFAAGHHVVTFDGRGVSSGVYFYQLVAGDYRNCRKMVLLK